MSLNNLDKRVRIEQNTPTQSTSGEMIDAWSVYRVVYAALAPVSGGERFQGHQVHADANIAMTCRYPAAPDLTPAMRVLYNGRTFDILAALNWGERGVEWRIDLRERALG